MSSGSSIGTISTTSTTYTSLANGATATDSKAGPHQVLVTLQATCDNTNNDSGCLMSFSATGGLTRGPSDNWAFGDGRSPGPAPDRVLAGSGSFLVTVTGPTTFTAAYRASDHTARFYSSSVIIQAY